MNILKQQEVEEVEEVKIDIVPSSRYNNMQYILSWCKKQRSHWESGK